ncbi:FAD-dependent oxidoreductase [Deinococcus sonorensis]|uniref:FAD-dependent oxidoreductase n=2 Tax=Deinococcus sonorensis TaxID=309891 RepID=A0AAU7U6P8_9DEIO
MNQVKNVLMVGGGIAGLVAASMLRDRGVQVDMVELNRAWNAYGVGIIQQGNVVRAMAQAGLLDRYLSAGFPFEDVEFYSPDGVRRARIPGERLAGAAFPANLGVRRSALHDTLKEAALEKGTRVSLGVTVERFEQQDDHVDVTFTDGRSGRYDLVIGADGAYSRVRTLLFGERYRPQFVGQSVWRHNFPRTPDNDALQTFRDTQGNSAGLVPLSEHLMYLYLTTREPGNPFYPREALARLMRERLQHFVGRVAELREQITDPAEVVYRPMEVTFIEGDWFQGRVLLIGDAAHTTTPHLGQGAGMAIEDAVVLSLLLEEDQPVPQTLRAFMDRRYARAQYIQQQSLMICRAELENDHTLNHPKVIGEMLHYTAQRI